MFVVEIKFFLMKADVSNFDLKSAIISESYGSSVASIHEQMLTSGSLRWI